VAIHLTPDDLARLQDKKVANVLRKLNAGKTLTAHEDAILANARTPAPGAAAPAPTAGYAKSWDELAAALNVEERTLYDFRKRHAAEIHAQRRQLTRPNGRHVIAEWKKLAEETGELNGRGLNNPNRDALNERLLRLRELKVRLDRQEFELAKEMELWIEITDVEMALGHMLATFGQSLNAMPPRLARLLGDVDTKGRLRELLREHAAALRKCKNEDAFLVQSERLLVKNLPEPDYHSRKHVIEAEIEITKRTFRGCTFITPKRRSLSDEAAQSQHADGTQEAS
jgi:hypothetical protein